MKTKALTTTLFTFGAAALFPLLAPAATVTLTGSDAVNTSSFNTAGLWNNAAVPSAGNDYVTGDFRLRTPANGSSHTFAGDSLTLNSTTAGSGGLMYKGTGTAGTITINNLIMAGGWIHHQNGLGDLLQLAGNINVTADSTFWAKQGNMNISAALSGSANLTIQPTDATGEDQRYVTLMGNNSAFTGKIIMGGLSRLRILSEENLGGNPASFTADQFTFNNGWLAVTNSVVLNDANRGITLNGVGGSFSVANSNATLTVAVPITGGGLLTKIGVGALTLSGNNDFSGGLTFSAGSQLNLNSATALGFGTLTLASAGMRLDNTSGSAVTVTTGNPQTWNLASFTFLGSSSLNLGLGGVTLGANSTVIVSNNNLTVGSVSGGFGLTKQGAGTLTIDGGSFYSGNTSVSEGTLVLATSSTLSSPVITVASNATLNTSGLGLALAFGQTLAGSGTVVGNVTDGGGSTAIVPGPGAGTLTINGNLALSGGTTLNFELTPTPTVGSGVNDLIVVTGELSFGNTSGTSALNLIGSTGSGVTYTLFQYNSFSGDLANVTVPPGFVLTNNTANKTIQLIASHTPANLTWRGDGLLNAWDVGVTANWIQSGTNQMFFNSDTVTFDDNGSNNVAVTLASDVSPAAVIVNASQPYTFTGAGIVSGSLTKSGSGLLVLDNTNTYSGATVINAGTLQLGDSTSGSFGQAGTIGTGPVTNNGVLQFNRSGGANLTIAANIAGSGSISNLSSGGTVVLSGTVSGTTVNQTGFGLLRLSGSNDYSGLTLISSGTLSVQNTNALGSAAAGTIVDSGTLYFDLNQPMVVAGESITLQNNGTMARGGAQAITLLSPVTVEASNGRLQVDGGSTMTLSNELSGAGAIEKIQGGTLVFAASNSFSGGLTVSAGTLTLAHNNAIGNNAGITVTSTTGGPGLSGTRVTLSGGVSIPASKSLSLPSSGAGTIRSTLFATGAGVTNTWAGPITLTGDLDPLNAIGFGVDANSVFIISGNVTGDSSFAGRINMRGNATGVGIITSTLTLSPVSGQIVVDDASTWVVTSTGNTWATNIFAGGSTLRVGANNALPTASVLSLGNGTANRFDLGGFNQQLAGLDVTGVNITNTSTSADSTLTYAAAGVSTFGGRISDGVRKLNLTLTTGTLVLTNAATLNLSKSTVTVASGGVLQLDYVGTNQVFGLVLNGVNQTPGIYSSATSAPYLAGTGSLLVQPGPSGPVTLTNIVSGNQLSLSWPAGQGWRLQAQTNSLSSGLNTNWFYVTDGTVSSTNLTVNPANPTVFFRLRYP
jgi:fibronectin-binding autotransporter adhesin